jgi:DNA-binding transcriptional LysR family regulator
MMSFNGYDSAIAAAVQGQGVALGRRPLIDALLRTGRLVVPFGDATATQRGLFLIVEPSSRRRLAVQAFEQWLLRQAGLAA